MVTFDKSSALAPSVAPPRPVRSEEDLTHTRQGPIGPTHVVPDGYTGPQPPGAISESDYQRMQAVYGNIASGESSLRFDTANFFQNDDGTPKSLLADPLGYAKAALDAGAFKVQYMEYVQDLVKTPAGLKMLEQLDHSKFETIISQNSAGDGNNTKPDNSDNSAYDRVTGLPSKGTASKIEVDPTATVWDGECGNEPWMADRPRFGFYHELVHAYHNTRGDAESWGGHLRAGCDPHVDEDPVAWPIGNVEWHTAGLGPWANESVSENSIRGQMGVPLRPTYSGRTWSPAPHAVDLEEPPRVPPVHAHHAL